MKGGEGVRQWESARPQDPVPGLPPTFSLADGVKAANTAFPRPPRQAGGSGAPSWVRVRVMGSGVIASMMSRYPDSTGTSAQS